IYETEHYDTNLTTSDIPKGRFGLTGPYPGGHGGPSLPVRVPGLDVSGEMVNIEDDEYNPVNFFDGIDRTHVRSMRNRKIHFSGGLVGIAGSDSYRRPRWFLMKRVAISHNRYRS